MRTLLAVTLLLFNVAVFSLRFAPTDEDVVFQRQQELSERWRTSALYAIKNLGLGNNNHNVSTNVGSEETVCIMTRDHICLSSKIYTPPLPFRPPFPVLYAKTPYGKNSLDADAIVANADGWLFIGQDCRGRGQSNGSYSFWRTSGNDTLDTMQWMLDQKWSDGNMAVIGVSANALAQYADVIGVTQFPVGSNDFNHYNALFQHLRIGEVFLGDGMGYHTVYPGGAYREGLISGWLTGLHEPDMITTVIENEVFNPWWYPLSGPYNEQWQWINQSLIHFAGFYDIFSTPQILTAMAANNTGQIDAAGNQILIVDPGGHCPMGDILWPHDLYGFETVEIWGIPAINAAFEYGRNNDIGSYNIHDYFPFNVMWYQLGPGRNEEGNFWVQAESFPPNTPSKWYFAGNGALQTTSPAVAGSQSYVYDPKHPVVTHGGNNLILQPCGPWSQTPNEAGRADILHFNSSALTANIALVGMLVVDLFVSSDAVDTDFTAKVIDVFPNGEPYLVQDSIFRMRWRNEGRYTYATAPAPNMVGGQVYQISIDVGFMSYVYNTGHKISVSISSSNYKRFSINYNSGHMVADGDKDWVKATNAIHYGGQYPSALVLPAVDMKWINDRRVPLSEIEHTHEMVQQQRQGGQGQGQGQGQGSQHRRRS